MFWDRRDASPALLIIVILLACVVGVSPCAWSAAQPQSSQKEQAQKTDSANKQRQSKIAPSESRRVDSAAEQSTEASGLQPADAALQPSSGAQPLHNVSQNTEKIFRQAEAFPSANKLDSVAAATPQQLGLTQTAPTNLFAQVMRMLWALVIVIALIIITLFFLRSVRGLSTGALTANQASLRVLNRVMLDPKNVVYLVKAMDTVLVVGVGPAAIQVLTEIKDPRAIAMLEAEAAGGAGGMPPFYSQFRRLIDKYTASGGDEPGMAQQGASGQKPLTDQLSDIREQIERLKEQSRRL